MQSLKNRELCYQMELNMSTINCNELNDDKLKKIRNVHHYLLKRTWAGPYYCEMTLKYAEQRGKNVQKIRERCFAECEHVQLNGLMVGRPSYWVFGRDTVIQIRHTPKANIQWKKHRNTKPSIYTSMQLAEKPPPIHRLKMSISYHNTNTFTVVSIHARIQTHNSAPNTRSAVWLWVCVRTLRVHTFGYVM